ncbi:NUDIX domain-containing protein [Bradyrhizobium sp. 83012]|uniref:NUDIX domain-containing protein n=1 Tax=Bradyrhizobium aeschynomenes TaxID=2734909 RepID=A0ABX2CJN0_9BRAD|nr:NUDIX domain-containing protein [Bradyrhizobium aeschynomenes]NPU68402.1 NUDIX domain-containing protein [Bradyrhizobium aeschynomenes]NPV25136.1 NUDIX domain-containing protein [Bradyrhizobium aeschynomenes]
MRARPSSRLLVLDPQDRLLLFKFVHLAGALAGQQFWATPGGGLDPGESYEAAACREMFEETGIRIDHPGPQIMQRAVTFTLVDGEQVSSDERYFLIRVAHDGVSSTHWTELERAAITAQRWWRREELAATSDRVFPEDITDMLRRAGVW